MTSTRAADRIDDRFPHGTPAGYRDGCRGNGGCPNRGTTRMTCVEAHRRYASDLGYRRAYDAGDVIFDRLTALDPAIEKAHASAARRAGHRHGTSTDRKSQAVEPHQNFVRDATAATLSTTRPRPADHATPAHQTPAADSGATPGTPPDLPRATEAALLEQARQAARRISALEQQLTIAEHDRQAAKDLAALAGRERAAALTDRDAAVAELRRVRAALEDDADLRQRLTPRERPVIEFRTVPDGLHVSLNVLVAPESVQALADHLTARSA